MGHNKRSWLTYMVVFHAITNVMNSICAFPPWKSPITCLFYATLTALNRRFISASNDFVNRNEEEQPRRQNVCETEILCLRLHPLTSVYLCTLWKKKKSCVIQKGPVLYMLRNSQKWVSAEVTVLLPFMQRALSSLFYFRGLYYIILCVAVGW